MKDLRRMDLNLLNNLKNRTEDVLRITKDFMGDAVGWSKYWRDDLDFHQGRYEGEEETEEYKEEHEKLEKRIYEAEKHIEDLQSRIDEYANELNKVNCAIEEKKEIEVKLKNQTQPDDSLDIKDVRLKLESMGERTEKLNDEELIQLLTDIKYHNDKKNNRALKKLKRMSGVTYIKWVTWCLVKKLDNGEFDQALNEANKHIEKFIKELTITKI